jgi:hypothetical protein
MIKGNYFWENLIFEGLLLVYCEQIPVLKFRLALIDSAPNVLP